MPEGLTTAAHECPFVARREELDLLTRVIREGRDAVGSDESGQIQPGFAEVVYAAEQVRLDPTSSDRDLKDAIKVLSDAQPDFSR